ncbi:hypothetical protein SPOG_05166 [Schizosaccharomyces cryophilus OY26]|uniref:Uncharacterized protein n=1 Tax=Schizosaccharomyces cryophilus (strain OY26 / ATCC MYA-4695 / CBS 11777 / NBRC 106824 / NRRL Y48691) TaxID=653667 RepID=S9X0X1_SCHCR|nr:uncharacterized protein SPOG_05166 [Schizosaccharomyces cryophilus OY26]EPY50647.1 hypothetical protein SPOG_05166 [Schizosaccharomyces cryophilus OY26]
MVRSRLSSKLLMGRAFVMFQDYFRISLQVLMMNKLDHNFSCFNLRASTTPERDFMPINQFCVYVPFVTLFLTFQQQSGCSNLISVSLIKKKKLLLPINNRLSQR